MHDFSYDDVGQATPKLTLLTHMMSEMSLDKFYLANGDNQLISYDLPYKIEYDKPPGADKVTNVYYEGNNFKEAKHGNVPKYTVTPLPIFFLRSFGRVCMHESANNNDLC
jgi:hypothetical protein